MAANPVVWFEVLGTAVRDAHVLRVAARVTCDVDGTIDYPRSSSETWSSP